MIHEHPPSRFNERLHSDIDRIRSDAATWMSEAGTMIKTHLWADVQEIGKANVTGYCIKFQSLKDINLDTLKEAIKDGMQQTRA